MDKKKLLFIGVGFHEYDAHIIDNLKREYEVWYLWSSEQVQKHPYLHILSSKIPWLFPNLSDEAIKKYIYETKELDFDVIFVIKGSNLTDEHLYLLRQNHIHAKFKLYLWDEWNVMRNRDALIKYFPEIYSFDNEDCKKYGFRFRPLFYIRKGYSNSKRYDISFVGGEHSNRFEKMVKLKECCIKQNLKYKLVVTMTLSVIINNLFKNRSFMRNKDVFAYKAIPYDEFVSITRDSKVVIDIHNKRQAGLTMRTIEALASCVKVVTTNDNIRNYANIPSNMYYVWDEKISSELLNFIKAPAPKFELDPYFSVDSFLKDILN